MINAINREHDAVTDANFDAEVLKSDKPTLVEQQEVNVTLAADFAAFIRGVALAEEDDFAASVSASARVSQRIKA